MTRTGSIRRLAPRAAVVIAALGLVGAGTATGASLITGKQIKNSSVTGSDIKNKSLGLGDLSPKARTALKGATGPAGPTGAKGDTGAAGAAGAAGAKGDTGDRGPSDGYFSIVNSSVNAPDAMGTVDTLDLPTGKFLITATVEGLGIGDANRNLSCQLLHGATVLNDDQDFITLGTQRAHVTMLAAVELSGILVNSNDIELQCSDGNSGLLIQTSMTAVKVAALTAA
ncbi:MAG: hypothetical protein ACJ762_16320 [Solirubrobacteraceae bacterium]